MLNGYYDLATPFSATEYVMTHLGLPPSASSRIQMKYYEAGHMMYVNPPSLEENEGRPGRLHRFHDAALN